MSRVVVVGGGVGGLAAAARLARLRHDVVLLERSAVVGGKVGVLSRDGFTFDTGPSLVTLPATLRDLFLKTGRGLETVVDLQPLDVLAHYRFDDGTELDVPNTGVRHVAAAFQDALGGDAGRRWRNFYERAEKTWNVVRTPFVESPLEGNGPLLRLALRRPADLLRVAPWRTLRAVGRQAFDDPRQQLFLDRYATYSGSDPRQAPGVLAVVPFVEQAFRGWDVAGGVRAIVDAMLARAQDRGVDVRTGAEVVEVTETAGRVDGVRLADGSRHAADIVVSNVDATTLYSHLLPRPDVLRAMRRATPSSAGFVLLLGLRGTTPGRRRHTVLFGPDYDAELDAVFGDEAEPPREPTVYVSARGAASCAPPGSEAWFVLVNAPRHGHGPGAVDWSASGVASSYADHILDVMARRGLDVRDRIAVREVRTPADLEDETASPGGAIYGTSSNGWRAATLRPRNRSPVPGLFLVGGSTHPGGGLPLVLTSAALVADMVGRA